VVAIDDVRLSAKGRATIASATEVFVSSASIWEASIKVGLGKLDADISRLVSEIAVSGFRELPVTAKHASVVADLPNVHRDPFDRMLVAQAMTE
jgi:PIN domain nuclease of toxin-antitoxin system